MPSRGVTGLGLFFRKTPLNAVWWVTEISRGGNQGLVIGQREGSGAGGLGLTPLLPSCVTLSKRPNLSVTQFLPLKWVIITPFL